MAISKNDIRFIRSLQQKKVRNEEGVFVVEGKKMVEEALELKWIPLYLLSTDASFCELHDCEFVSENIMSQCSSLVTPSGYLAVIANKNLPVVDFNSSNRIVVLNGVADPGNLGTILRTCEWFGINGVILDENCVELENPKVIQATMGAAFRLPTTKLMGSEILELLENCGFYFMTADMQGTPVYSLEKQGKWALIMGSESHGLSPLFKGVNPIHIPRMGGGESLNVGVATGIILSQLTQE